MPFDGDTFMGILGKHMFDPPPKPSELVGDLRDIEPVVLKALSKKPEDRYSSMDELLADVDRLRAGQEISVPLTAAATPPGHLGGYASEAPDALPQSRMPLILIGGFVVLLALALAGAGLVESPGGTTGAPAAPVADGPRLQTRPEYDLAAWRRRERMRLETLAWVDHEAGIARIPIERAAALVVQQGTLPRWPEAADGVAHWRIRKEMP